MAVKVPKRDFNSWFSLQFGLRGGSAIHEDEDLYDLIKRGEAARAELDRRKAYDEARRAALLGWTAATPPVSFINRRRIKR